MSFSLLRLLLLAGLVVYLFGRNLPGALIFLRPAWIRTRMLGGAESVATASFGPAMRQMADALEDLGFAPVGIALERRPLSRGRRELIFANPDARSFAAVTPVGGEAWLRYVTHYRDGAAVITADYRWPSVEEPGYLAGGIPGGDPAEILKTHERRVRRFVEEGREPDDRFTGEAWAERENAYYASRAGGREIRRREIKGMMFTTALVVLIVLILVRGTGR